MSETKQINKNNTSRTSPRLVIIRKYCGSKSMPEVFGQMLENCILDQFEEWLQSKAS